MPSRKPLIAGNWKMHKTGTEAALAARQLTALTADAGDDVEVMIAPTFTALSQVKAELAGSTIELGAQNLHWEEKGAFTGEIAADMLIDAGCTYVIIGHSERRQFFGETDQTVNKRTRAAVNAGLRPVLCIGESEVERDAGQTFSVLDKQLQNGLESFVLQDLQRLVIAYEPVWAIGTGKTATSEQAQQVHAHLRKQLASLWDDEFAQQLRILYGGSVKPSNVAELMAMPDVDGALVGGASLDPETFSQLVHYKK
ncbi:MAG: triose-phosphate isomerase [Desulfatitalea sp.]|nr:triose-phosphate isomerase [Desulfatitalea sp.]NNK01060.1 triose-phosphate isomerase [Desulfatitalea sp.]